MKLLTTANSKIKKGEKSGFKTFGIHLAPARLSGFNTCPHASAGCAAACLNTAGMGAFSTVQAARVEKTQFFFQNPVEFIRLLKKEIEAAIRQAAKNSLTPVFRLNLTSDINWENYGIIQAFPSVQFYDYTKNLMRMSKFLRGMLPRNLHLTFSRSETNGECVSTVLENGGNVAVVFRKQLPDTWQGRQVVDGDVNDLRFLDPAGCVVGLVAKGKARKSDSGFVVESVQ